MPKIFHRLVDYKEAIEILSKSISEIRKTEEIDIFSALGRISAANLYSNIDNPPFDRSEVDGYAVRHESIISADDENPVELQLKGEIEVGSHEVKDLSDSNSCLYIATGAPVPRGSDAVVMVEYTKRIGDRISFFRSAYSGENIAHAGSDFTVNELVLRENEIITPEKIALLSASGFNKVRVFSRINVGIISTGNEILQPGNELRFGEIYDVNGPYVYSVLKSLNFIEPEYLGILRDDFEEVNSNISKFNKKYPILVTSGSTSAGFRDLLYQVLDNLGGTPLYHGISIKPGKPSFLYKLNQGLVIGLPGFPLSSASVIYSVILPSIYRAFGLEYFHTEKGKVGMKVAPERGKMNILPAVLSRSGELLPIFGESGSISRISQADGFIMLSGDRSFYEKGDEVDFYPLFKENREIISIGSNDPLLEEVISRTTSRFSIINAGSMGGVEAMRNGLADVSGLHLYNNGVYNKFVMDEELKSKCNLVSGFERIQGIVSTKGFRSFRDLLTKGGIFVNRNRGSGTRSIIDELIEQELGKDFPKDSINNYKWEAKSHAAVARSVKQGRADMGVTIKYYADLLGLEFHEIKREKYDILISKTFMNSDVGKRFLENLKSLRNSTPPRGYYIPEDIGTIII